MATLKAGDEVTIYEDPYTRRQPEGEATITKVLRPETREEAGRFRVRFRDESQEYGRRIYTGPAWRKGGDQC